MNNETRVQERDQLLDDITVAPAPSRYADIPPVSRYAGVPKLDRYAAVNRYRDVPPPPVRELGPVPDDLQRKVGRLDRNRYAAVNRPPQHQLVRRTILVVPTVRAQGRLLWVPLSAYVERVDECGGCVYPLIDIGTLIDFDYAAEVARYRWGARHPEPVNAVTVADEAETFVEAYDTPEADTWPELMDQALKFRAELATDPEGVALAMDLGDLQAVARWTGMDNFPVPMEVAAAIADDPDGGLGGAALDYATWRMSAQFGHGGAELLDAADRVEEELAELEESLPQIKPSENFLLYSGSLPADVASVDHPGYPGDRLYPMTGTWVVCRIDYTSDLTGKVIGGWRSLYLEPLPEESPLVD